MVWGLLMNWKLLRRLFCGVAALALIVALAHWSATVLTWAQDSTGKAPAAQPAPKQDSTNPPAQAAPKQDSTNPPGQEGPEYTIGVTTQLVTTPVTVFDSSGNFVYDLEKDEFKIYDNGELQDISQFDSEMRRLSLEENRSSLPTS